LLKNHRNRIAGIINYFNNCYLKKHLCQLNIINGAIDKKIVLRNNLRIQMPLLKYYPVIKKALKKVKLIIQELSPFY